jgi:hypothetical protein
VEIIACFLLVSDMRSHDDDLAVTGDIYKLMTEGRVPVLSMHTTA